MTDETAINLDPCDLSTLRGARDVLDKALGDTDSEEDASPEFRACQALSEILQSAPSPIPPNPNADRMMKWLAYEHLPPELASVSRPFHDLAELVTIDIAAGPERTVALRKLVEAKDAAVRAKVHPGG